MNKILYLAGLLFLAVFSASAQKEGQPLADSLEQVLTRKDISETERVDVLAQLTFEYRNLLPAKAIAFGEQAEKLAKEIHYEKKLGEIYIYQSYAYTFYNDIIKSYELALSALKYNTENKVSDLIPISRLLVYSSNPNNRKGEDISEVLDILKEVNTIKDKIWYIRTIGGLGNELKETSANQISDSLINLAMEEARINNFKFLEMHNLARVEGSLMYKKEYDKALRLIEQLNAYFETIGEKRIYSELLTEAADIYILKADLNPEKNFLDSAQWYADRALKKSSEIDYKNVVVSNYLIQFRLNKKSGNVSKAMDYLEKYVALNDTLYGQNTNRKLEGIAIRQRDEISEARLKAKDAEMATQKMYTYSGFAGIGLTGLFLFFVFRNYKNQKKSNQIISLEKQRSEELLLNILPAEMAEELKANGTTKAKAFTMVTVMFTDFKDFTTVSEKVSAELLVDEIHYCFSAFDRILQKYKIEKIKTIGDSYMCASGLPVSNYTHATDMLAAAFEIRDFMLQRKKEKEGLDQIPFELRIGIHTGPVVAGIVGIKKFAYDIWGDTVNMAARMEQNSEAGKINISGNTYELVKTKFNCEHRGKISAKNKGEIDMYFVERKTI